MSFGKKKKNWGRHEACRKEGYRTTPKGSDTTMFRDTKGVPCHPAGWGGDVRGTLSVPIPHPCTLPSHRTPAWYTSSYLSLRAQPQPTKSQLNHWPRLSAGLGVGPVARTPPLFLHGRRPAVQEE